MAFKSLFQSTVSNRLSDLLGPAAQVAMVLFTLLKLPSIHGLPWTLNYSSRSDRLKGGACTGKCVRVYMWKDGSTRHGFWLFDGIGKFEGYSTGGIGGVVCWNLRLLCVR